MKYCILFFLLTPSIAFAQFRRGTSETVKRTVLESVNPLTIIRLATVQREIDVIPEQQEKLERMWKEHRAAAVLQSEAVNKIDDPDEKTKFFTESEAENNARSTQLLDEILLPHQKKRLDQLVLRVKVEQYGIPVLAEEPGIKHLGFPQETFDKLEDVQEQAYAEREQAVKQAHLEYVNAYKNAEKACNEKILSVLTPTQRKAVDEMLGPPLKERGDDSHRPK